MQAQNTLNPARTDMLWLTAAVSAVRAAFGLIWTINAILTWLPQFSAHYVGYLQNAMQGQPRWLLPWFNMWLSLVTPAADVFIWVTRIIETLIAIGLLFGLARKWTYIIGMAFSLLIWSTAEGFGGPYSTGASNLGPALVYVLLFAALMLTERLLGRTPYSVDYYIEQRHPRWTKYAEWAPAGILAHPPTRLSWPVQGGAIAIILLAFVFFFGTLQSAFGASPATPENASAAVTPLQLKSQDPVAEAHDAKLPPLLGQGDSIDITIESTDVDVEIASGVKSQAWTFNNTVPAPILHMRQGQTLNVTFVNKGHMQHSIDFHSAEIDPSVNYRSINPGESLKFSFEAKVPGIFIYHCGTPPVLQHIAMGMYGAIIVDPADDPMPPADVSYVIVQSEWYTQQVKGNLLTGNFEKMLAVAPDEVVFNGVAFQYKDHPLEAKVGQRVRIYFLDAGPNLTSSFHVIGAIFDKVYPGGDLSQSFSGVSTYTVAPGQGMIFDVIFQQPGEYVLVDHSMRAAFLGAQGFIKVTP